MNTHRHHSCHRYSCHYESNKPHLFLALACLWPVLVLIMFGSFSSQHQPRGDDSYNNNGGVAASPLVRFNLRNVLDRVDIMGYGPTHPRIGVVITGDATVLLERNAWVDTVESIFANTDMTRIFMVVVLVDGMTRDPDWEAALTRIHSGQIPHYHESKEMLHVHRESQKASDQDDTEVHDSKVYVMFNDEKQGITRCRLDGAEFLHILAQHHEQAGLKSISEDLILVLVDAGVTFTSRHWLKAVTQSLIVPPPLLPLDETGNSNHNDRISLKVANAVSFNVEGSKKRTTMDSLLMPQTESAAADELNLSSGASYLAPIWSGAVLALRLETWRQLPIHDEALTEAWPANVDLSMALWLCGDGMDTIVTDENALFIQQLYSGASSLSLPTAPASPAMAARFAEAWMDEIWQSKFFHEFTHAYPELTFVEWQTLQAQARTSSSFVTDLTQKCRSIEWYMHNVNPRLARIWDQSPIVDNVQPKPGNKKNGSGGGKQDDKDSVAMPRRDQVKPSKTLCKECLAIVEKVIPVHLEYVDVSGGHKDHPHLGAKDVNGKWGYIHDETHLRRNPPPFNMSKPDLLTACIKRDYNYRMLTEKVFMDLKGDQEARQKLGPDGRVKLFCLVYTIDKSHGELFRIRETWAQRCDGFMVGSNKTDPDLDAVEIPHEGPEAYENIWQKVRSIWAYVYDNYYQKYDWFHIGGDDYYLLIENLRLYLESEEIRTAANGGHYLPTGSETTQTPLFLGRRFALNGNMDYIFNSGGSGYTINKAALKLLVTQGLDQFRPHAKTFSEDTVIAALFRNIGNVYPYPTKDENMGERYMPFMPGSHYWYRMPADISSDWYAKYSINIKTGRDHCAARSIAFHYVKQNDMYRLHAMLYGLCPPGTLS